MKILIFYPNGLSQNDENSTTVSFCLEERNMFLFLLPLQARRFASMETLIQCAVMDMGFSTIHVGKVI